MIIMTITMMMMKSRALFNFIYVKATTKTKCVQDLSTAEWLVENFNVRIRLLFTLVRVIICIYSRIKIAIEKFELQLQFLVNDLFTNKQKNRPCADMLC